MKVHSPDAEEAILSVELRRNIYAVVVHHPGCHLREIERRCALATGTVTYHLDYLVKKKMLTVTRDGNVRYFPVTFTAGDKHLMGLLRQKSIRRIFLRLLEGSSTHEEVMSFVGLSPSTISWHLQKLHKQGYVTYKKDGRRSYYGLSVDKEVLTRLLITHQRSFLDGLLDRVVESWDT